MIDSISSEKRKGVINMNVIDRAISKIIQKKIQSEAKRYKMSEQEVLHGVSYLSNMKDENKLEAEIYLDMLPDNYDFEPAENVIQFINDETDWGWD